MNSLVPQFFEASVENRVGEQIVDSSVPLFMGEDMETEISAPQESVQNHTLEQVVDFPAPPNMKVYAGRVRAFPQERVQNRILEPVTDVPLPHIKQGAVSTGKVFTVKLRHHRDDHASSDNVGFIKGLDKHNMPRLGDVMVPPPEINKVSWFDRKPQLLRMNLCTASIKGTRAAAAVPSSNVELWAFSRVGRGGGVRGGDGGLAGLRLQRFVVGLFLRLWTSLRPCRLSSNSLHRMCGWCLRSSSSTSASTSCFMVAKTHSANCALPLRFHRCCSFTCR